MREHQGVVPLGVVERVTACQQFARCLELAHVEECDADQLTGLEEQHIVVRVRFRHCAVLLRERECRGHGSTAQVEDPESPQDVGQLRRLAHGHGGIARPRERTLHLRMAVSPRRDQRHANRDTQFQLEPVARLILRQLRERGQRTRTSPVSCLRSAFDADLHARQANPPRPPAPPPASSPDRWPARPQA
jgi:ribosomal protein L22